VLAVRPRLVLLALVACRPAAPTKPPDAAPATIPEPRAGREPLLGEVTIEVTTETFETPDGPAPAWVYLTRGNAAFGQPEVEVVLLRRGPTAAGAHPRDFLPVLARYLGSLHAHAAPLLPGMAAVVPDDAPPLVPGTELRAMLFVRFDAATTAPRPAGRLTAIFLTADEYRATMVLGQVRLLARLGVLGGAFPTAPWTDPARAPVLGQAERARSILGELPSHNLVGASVVHHTKAGQRRVTLEIEAVAADALRRLADEPRSASGFAILTPLTPRADAYIVWRPDQPRPEGIAFAETGGDDLGGNFVALIQGPEAADEFRRIEDGFAVVLGPAAWPRLQAALRERTPVEFTLRDTTVSLTFRPPSPR
jgi:hypothetical protein